MPGYFCALEWFAEVPWITEPPPEIKEIIDFLKNQPNPAPGECQEIGSWKKEAINWLAGIYLNMDLQNWTVLRRYFKMIRAKLWFRCAAMHDPVTPRVVSPSLIGWEAKRRRVDLTIERAFNGEELVRRMKGWVTADPQTVIEVIRPHGRLKVLDDRELVVEMEKPEDFEYLQKTLAEKFAGEVDLEAIPRR